LSGYAAMAADCDDTARGVDILMLLGGFAAMVANCEKSPTKITRIV
jgi:hypothetical protein